LLAFSDIQCGKAVFVGCIEIHMGIGECVNHFEIPRCGGLMQQGGAGQIFCIGI
jgi:hypothetical protein